MLKTFKLGAIALSSLLAFSSTAYAAPVEFTDILDRKVTVDVPAKRVVLAFNYQDYMAVAGVKSFDNVVGFSKAVWTDWAPASWAEFSKAVPRLNELEDVGEVEVGTFSVEKILALKPDVVVMADWQYKALDSDLEPLEKAGIPVVVIDYLAQTVEKHVKSTEIIGLVTGNETKAKELNEEYKAVVKDIQDRIAKANPAKPKVYVEFGNKGPKEHSFTFGKSMWGAMLNLVGADNIAKEAVEFYSPINPELVLAAKPDVVIISGRETELKKNPEAMVMGFSIEESEARKRLNGFKDRSGWSELPAIKSNRLYGAYHANSRTLSDSASIQFVAKAVYPELFADLDPTKTYLEFYRKNLPIVPQGTFYLYPESK
ncbi:ABC transporter substrate-binding protein [Ursidibacter sp. B-7004-1]